MRDELAEALAVAAADPDVVGLELHGEGRAFCAGGDMDEFGSRADPAAAHVVRLATQRGPGAAHLSRLGKATVAYLHGATFGSGIELAAFVRHRASPPPDTRDRASRGRPRARARAQAAR